MSDKPALEVLEDLRRMGLQRSRYNLASPYERPIVRPSTCCWHWWQHCGKYSACSNCGESRMR